MPGSQRVNIFRQAVRLGKLGKTAKFWMMYMDCVWHLLRFQQAIKENNFDLYISSMYSLCPLLFAADHHNYARYLPCQYMTLKNLSLTHPEAEELLRDNGFSVCRSSVPACRNAVDITIEQTINRSAKTAGGIVGFSRNASAYQRWCVTRYTRATYAEAAMDRVGLETGNNDIHKSLQSSRLKSSDVAVHRLLDGFGDFINPFNITDSGSNSLYCLSSGQPATDKVASDLLGYMDAGQEAAEKFVVTRLRQKTVKFQDVIKRLNRSTFKSMAVHKKMTTTQQKTVEIKAERNLLGRLLFLSQEHDISLPKLFEYPLGPIPWAIATAGGGMTKTNKAKLMHHLESLGTPCNETNNTLKNAITIVDGNALLQAVNRVPETFEDLSLQVFNCLPHSNVVHFVTDSYKADSIKQCERARRGQTAEFVIGGAKTKLPRDFKSFMLNSNNKRQLIKLLLREWSKYSNNLCGRTVFFVDEEACWILTSDGITVTCVSAAELCSDQEEADTRIILHCLQASKNSESNTPIIVKSPDTDLLILLVSYASAVAQPLYLDTGSGNKRRLVDIKAIAHVLGPDICTALPAYHAFTGCDYTSAFVRKGKVKPLQILRNQPDILKAFKDLGNTPDIQPTQFVALERFICAMYGQPKSNDTNTVRYKMFQQRYDVKSDKSSFSIPNGVDLSLLPPCRQTLKIHILRANYVAYVWKTSDIAYQKLPSPIEHGWMKAEDGTLTIEWTRGNVLPQELVDVLSSTSSSTSVSVVEENDEEFEDSFEEVEDCEVENIIDILFGSDDEDVDN